MGPGEIVALIVGGIPVAEIVKSIVVPPFAVLGKRMADRVERLFEKTGTMVQEAEFTPQPVSDKLIVEIVRGASLEEDEDLHTMWAALLANAASPEHDNVLPSFMNVLRQLSSSGAMFLNAVYNRHCAYLAATKSETEFVVSRAALFDVYAQDMSSPGTAASFSLTVDDLQRLGLLGAKLTGIAPVHSDSVYSSFEPQPTQAEYGYHLTDYGLRFVQACRAPKAKS